MAEKPVVDVTAAPAKILSVQELKNGKVFVATEAKLYEFMDGKLRPVTFADVEYEAVMAGSQPMPLGAVPSAPPPPPPPPKTPDGSPSPPPPSNPAPLTPMGAPPPASPKS
jgi:hypothetical protein